MQKDYIWKTAKCCCKNGKYLARIIDDLVIACDEIIDVVETKTVTINFNKKMQPVKQNKKIFYLPFFNYHSIIGSCQYLLLSDKIVSKAKTFIAILRHK